jgi:hypothetical protein
MRALLIFWAGPLAFFWGWYFLSLHDISLGTAFFSRQMHDLVFEVYGNILGVSPDSVPAMAAEACLVDSLILLALVAFRRRRALWRAAMRLRQAISAPAAAQAPEADPVPPAE